MDPLLQAKFNLIDQLRLLTVQQPGGPVEVAFPASDWHHTGQGGHRAVPLPFDEDFTLGLSYAEAGSEHLDFEVAHTVEVWVVRGRFDLRLGDGEWLEQRQGSTYILAPGQCHSMRVHERTYLVSAICPPLPLALPPTPDCHAH